ncbi:MAG: DUF3168 domain-containing protein [Gemmatimonadales bacterium]|nr:DUF3168 domain-containing protein [Gemmatimonadales bacterium]
MTIEGDVAQALKTYAPLDSLIGGRVAPSKGAPSLTPPCVVYQRISTAFQQTLGRNVAAEDARIQIDVWAKTDEDAGEAARHVIAAVLSMPLHQTRHVKATVIDNEIADWDQTAGLHRRIVDIMFASVEAA